MHTVKALEQACTTYGPWANCGPRKILFRPAQPFFLFFYLACLIETLFESAKMYHFWPLNIAKRNFLPAKRFELCTPDLKHRSEEQDGLRLTAIDKARLTHTKRV